MVDLLGRRDVLSGGDQPKDFGQQHPLGGGLGRFQFHQYDRVEHAGADPAAVGAQVAQFGQRRGLLLAQRLMDDESQHRCPLVPREERALLAEYLGGLGGAAAAGRLERRTERRFRAAN